ncbi:MAG: 40S ribosomal protein S3a/S1 [Nanoarchaeota archaeon]|nr:40S ribosomal protein S3a/S1 [Nanoarchaeota archaeon]MBU0962677.1 40S ribosomal protein S3a/S1 [Nanoarchaeota archaeon]
MAVSDALKKKKKIWVGIQAPKEFRIRDIGESLVSLPEQLINKVSQVNLASLTGDPKKQNIYISLKVKEIRENKGQTEIVEFNIAPSYLKRMNRMAKQKAEQSILLKTKDDIQMRIKAMAFSKYKANNSVLTAVRVKMKEFLVNNVTSKTYNEILNEIINFEFQKNLSRELKKIYPLSNIIVKSVIRK